MPPLVFGAPRVRRSPAPVREKRSSPLVFGADLPVDDRSAPPEAPRRRRYRGPDWELLRSGRCPYCGARLDVRVVGERPVFREVVPFSDEDDVVGLSEVDHYEPDLLLAVCPVCRREYEFRREVRGKPAEEFAVLLEYVAR